MSAPSRYRVENGAPTIDVSLPRVAHLFDNRDPAPFRERDLDPSLAEYLVGAAEDLAARDRFGIVFWFQEPCPPSEVVEAVRAHFDYELRGRDRRRRQQIRAGWITLAIAAVSIVALVALGELVSRVVHGSLGAGLEEALVISGWVLMWRPIEVLVYDGIPWRRERRVLRRLLEAPIDVRTGHGPPP